MFLLQIRELTCALSTLFQNPQKSSVSTTIMINALHILIYMYILKILPYIKKQVKMFNQYKVKILTHIYPHSAYVNFNWHQLVSFS